MFWPELAPARLAPARLVPARLVPARLAPARLLPARLLPARLAPARLAPARFSPDSAVETFCTGCAPRSTLVWQPTVIMHAVAHIQPDRTRRAPSPGSIRMPLGRFTKRA